MRTSRPAATPASMTWRMTGPDARGIVISSILAPVAAIAFDRSFRLPRTGTPAMLWPLRRRSSSRKPTGWTPAFGSRMAERAMVAPARPAPYSSAGTRVVVVVASAYDRHSP